MDEILSIKEQILLLGIARKSLTAAANATTLPLIDLDTLPERLRKVQASFATLTSGGALRGCIGSIEALDPLAIDVQRHTVDAALSDPRFPQVKPSELDSILIELSVLSIPQPLEAGEPSQRPGLLQPGIDGVLIRSGFHRATFLPQVWEKIPDPVQFLEMLCRKAHLAGDAWSYPEVELLTYQVEHFNETLLSNA